MFRDIIPFPIALKRGFISLAQECPAGAKALDSGRGRVKCRENHSFHFFGTTGGFLSF